MFMFWNKLTTNMFTLTLRGGGHSEAVFLSADFLAYCLQKFRFVFLKFYFLLSVY